MKVCYKSSQKTHSDAVKRLCLNLAGSTDVVDGCQFGAQCPVSIHPSQYAL